MFQLVQGFTDLWLNSMLRAVIHGGAAVIFVWLFIVAMKPMLRCPAWVEHWMWRLVYFKFILAVLVVHPVLLPLLSPTRIEPLRDSSTLPAFERSMDRWADATIGSDASTDSVEKTIPTISATLSVERPFDWRRALLAAWIVGVIVNFSIFAYRYYEIAHLHLSDADVSTWPSVNADQNEFRKLGKRLPRIAVSDQIGSPALIGLFRPAIVLSKDFIRECNEPQLRLAYHHELAHLVRKDLIWNLLPALVQILFFFHPLVWLAHRRWRLSSEMAADELAMERLRVDTSSYAEGLVQIAVIALNSPIRKASFSLVSAVSSIHSLKQRLLAMKTYRRSSHFQIAVYAASLGVISVFGILPWQVVHRLEAAPFQAEGCSVGKPTYYGKNMDFEETTDDSRAASWGGGGDGYSLILDEKDKQSGERSAWIIGVSDDGFRTYTQCIDAKDLIGKRIEFSGYLKCDEHASGGLWMRIDSDRNSVGFDNMDGRPVQGQTEWSEYKIVLDVPTEATKICFGFLMTGKGNLRGDNFKIEPIGPIGNRPAPTGVPMANEPFVIPSKPENLGFELVAKSNAKSAHGWGGGGTGYRLSRDTETKYEGAASGRIASIGSKNQFGTYTQGVSAKQYLGKRIRWTGMLKTENAKSAGLWMRIDGDQKEPLGFDNMGDRAVKGTTAWAQHAVILDVPKTASEIYFGFLNSGTGTVWGDAFELTIVGEFGEGPDTTSRK
ncbi:MAG: M56 family metallopeptidase [Pirellulaceae bacterium]|nr:M56 family metallopeptidase [Pirellulaceae bacterium]